MSIFSIGGSTPSEGFELKSGRFDDGSSKYLVQTPATEGHRTRWTFSVWAKRGNLSGSTQHIFGSYKSGSQIGELNFHSTDSIQWEEYNGGTVGKLRTTALYRDPAAWYHIVIVWDTQIYTAADKMKMYVNGERVTSFSVQTNPGTPSDSVTNWDGARAIGAQANGSAYMDGYIAEAYFLDGIIVLGPEAFAETDPLTNQYKPKDPTEV